MFRLLADLFWLCVGAVVTCFVLCVIFFLEFIEFAKDSFRQAGDAKVRFLLIVTLLAFGGLIWAASCPAQDVEKLRDSACFVHSFTFDEAFNGGTCFKVAPNYVVTNAHAVPANPKKVIVLFGNDEGDSVFGKLKAVDALHDLALIEVETPKKALELQLAPRGAVVDDSVFYIGYPMLLPQAVVRGTVATMQGVKIVITALCTNGASGSPLFNTQGFVVGVIQKNLNGVFCEAIPLEQLRDFLVKEKVVEAQVPQ